MSTHKIESQKLLVTIDDRGAELVSVFDKESGKERIWTAVPSIWNYHAPILFPFVGKVTGGVYRIGGKEYQMKTRHGFAREMDFKCTGETATDVTHCLTATPRTREIYPFDFSLTVVHKIDCDDPRRLHIDWKVENRGNDIMFYSIGGHPGFLIPETTRKEDCIFSFPGKDKLSYISADDDGFAETQKRRTLHLQKGCVRYQDDIPSTWIFEEMDIKQISISDANQNPLISMDCAAFPMVAVWANPAGPFICLEPWFGRTDDVGFQGTLEQKKGMKKLGKGEVNDISYSIVFHPLIG